MNFYAFFLFAASKFYFNTDIIALTIVVKKTALLMNALRRINAKMVLEIGKQIINDATKQMTMFTCKTETDLKRSNVQKDQSYEEAILALNGLQTNANTIQESIGRTHNLECPHVKETERYLQKIGVTLNDLDKLSIIHVSGTKGKGSTCALVESILRNLNVKTGFYSSPHLVHVTERIRLNGEPLTKLQFSQYFWKIYNKLEQTKQDNADMPPYFKFLTIMAYYVFLKERIDVAVIEVGIGGQYDCTNVVRNTQTVGITSLGLEHTSLLGNTYREIAWQKSGIIKLGSSVFSVRQNDECDEVIRNRAVELNANYYIVPAFSEYKYSDATLLDEIAKNPTKKLNASLAIQLSYDWIRKNSNKIENKDVLTFISSSDAGLTLPTEIAKGLEKCYWPGRCHSLVYKKNKLYVDGAHTIESMAICVNWFQKSTNLSSNCKFLLFNVTGERNANDLLKIIHENIQFNEALFTPNISSFSSRNKDNIYTFSQPNKTKEHSIYWNSLSSTNRSKVFSCISDVFSYLDLQKTNENEELTVLVTGSLHLIGEVIKTIRE